MGRDRKKQHKEYLNVKAKEFRRILQEQGFIQPVGLKGLEEKKSQENLGGTRSEMFLFGDPFEHTDFSDFWRRYKAFIKAPTEIIQEGEQANAG